MDEMEQTLLAALRERGTLPIARYELRSTKESDIISTALNYVWLTGKDDSMELAKARGAAIARLVEKELAAVSYSLAVTAASDYAVYNQSALFAQLCTLAEEGKGKPGFLFDTAAIKRGRLELTAKGKKAIRG